MISPHVETVIAAFAIEGIPEPKGSLSAFADPRNPGRIIMTHGSSKKRKDGSRSDGPERFKAWAMRVRSAATVWQITHRRELRDDEAIGVRLAFYMPRAISTPKRVKYPIRKPDLDKLTRCVCDALQKGRLIAEDARIIDLDLKKRYDPDRPRCEVTVWVIE